MSKGNFNAFDFYDKGKGDPLIDEKNFPPEVKDHLIGETKIITSTSKRGYTHLLEVGCMQGRLLELAIGNDLNYIGIDIIPRYIKSAKKRIKNLKTKLSCSADLCSVYDLPSFRKQRHDKDEKILAVFPFNSFGNIEDPNRALAAIYKSRSDVLILTYNTNKKTTQIRWKYYSLCDYTNLQAKELEESVLFTANEGLHTMAYRTSALRKMLRSHKFQDIDVNTFPPMGVYAYASAEK